MHRTAQRQPWGSATRVSASQWEALVRVFGLEASGQLTPALVGKGGLLPAGERECAVCPGP